MSKPQEIVDEEHEQVIERVAAIDVARASGMVCVRVPHESVPGRRVSRVWEVPATTRAVTELGDHLACEGIEKVTVESASDYWRIWLRREASCCIPGLAGGNLEDKGTIACQETGSRAQAYGAACRGIRVIWRKLDCLKPSLQLVQIPARRKDACNRCPPLRQNARSPAAILRGEGTIPCKGI